MRAAREFPIRLIESGPAAGAMAASYYGLLTRTSNLISFDMGGTTAKMCLIDRGWPEHAHEFEAGRVRRFKRGSGMPLKVPVVELIEIGAGGGSLARIDEMGLLKVGPESAGSDPGPVCYDHGGTAPTVTDVDAILGYLHPAFFLGGRASLNVERASRAFEEQVARPLSLPVPDAAAAIYRLANSMIYDLLHKVTIQRGLDPRQFALFSYGGTAGMHVAAYGDDGPGYIPTAAAYLEGGYEPSVALAGPESEVILLTAMRKLLKVPVGKGSGNGGV